MRSSLFIASLAGLMVLAVPLADAQRGGGQGGHGARGHHGGGAMRASMMLRAADANGDNTITRAEADQLRSETFDWMDRNGDGYLSAEDRSPAHQRLRARAEADGMDRERRRGRRGDRRDRAEALDTDEDGRISRAEYMAVESPMFDRLDANSDGSITPDELDAAVEARQERRERRGRWWRD